MLARMKRKKNYPTPKPKLRYLVFISHSSRDQWVARQMARVIESKGREHGVKSFLDEKDIETGDHIHESIRDSIRGCDEFMVLLTRRSASRAWVLIEMGAAWVLRKRVVAVIEDVTPEELPDIIFPYKAVDINKFDEYVTEIMRRAKKKTGRA
jgi:TIR domain